MYVPLRRLQKLKTNILQNTSLEEIEKLQAEILHHYPCEIVAKVFTYDGNINVERFELRLIHENLILTISKSYKKNYNIFCHSFNAFQYISNSNLKTLTF